MLEFTLKPLAPHSSASDTIAWHCKHAMTCALLNAQAAAYLDGTGDAPLALIHFREETQKSLRLFQSRFIQYQEGIL